MMIEVMSIFYGLVMLLFVLIFYWFLKEWLFGSFNTVIVGETYRDTISDELLEVETDTEAKYFTLHEKLHRVDGPAIIHIEGDRV